MEKLTNKEYEAEFEKYLNEGINWDANKHTVIKASYKSKSAREDVEQFAYDSFWYGAIFIMRKYGIEWAKDDTKKTKIYKRWKQ